MVGADPLKTLRELLSGGSLLTNSLKIKQQGNIFERNSSGYDSILQRHLADYRDLVRIISKCRCCQAEFKQLQLTKNNRGMSDANQTFQTPKRDGLFDIIDSR
jgi:hypothetical protein